MPFDSIVMIKTVLSGLKEEWLSEFVNLGAQQDCSASSY